MIDTCLKYNVDLLFTKASRYTSGTPSGVLISLSW